MSGYTVWDMSKHSEKKVSRRGHRLTPLGKKLDEIRERIEASGEPLLSSWEEVDRELAERRAGNFVELKPDSDETDSDERRREG
ncbi:MAG: hypothetical protein H0U65_01095 [Rubrobacter sp.]|nr:hypothetical protein [Rubrobacter sp.]